MSNARRKLQILPAFAMLFLLATTISCKDFFVNSPDSITISPNPVTFTNVGDSQQLTAQATFGNSTQNVTTSTVWQSSNGCAVAPSTTTIGQMTAIGTGSSVTITATYNGVSATTTASVPTGIAITPCGTSGKFNSGTTQTFTATSAGTDVTTSSTWTSSDNTIVNFANASSSAATFGPTKGTATITANNGSTTGQLQVTVQ
jgi:hypothetical protein